MDCTSLQQQSGQATKVQCRWDDSASLHDSCHSLAYSGVYEVGARRFSRTSTALQGLASTLHRHDTVAEARHVLQFCWQSPVGGVLEVVVQETFATLQVMSCSGVSHDWGPHSNPYACCHSIFSVPRPLYAPTFARPAVLLQLHAHVCRCTCGAIDVQFAHQGLHACDLCHFTSP